MFRKFRKRYFEISSFVCEGSGLKPIVREVSFFPSPISSFVCEGSGLNHLKHLRKTLNTT
ncbi:hypothetical protein [Leptospira noguchii]|uniref:hypothetical protein n=1 Tax=Leptospira noguchii TaxID=28182 RepID=UPI003B20F7BA